VGRLNDEERGTHLGVFNQDDFILTIHRDGTYQLTTFEFVNRYDVENIHIIEKFDPQTVISAVHFDGIKQQYLVKRFRIETQTVGKPFKFIGDHKGSRLIYVSSKLHPAIMLEYEKKRPLRRVQEQIKLDEFIDVKGWKSAGNRLCFFPVTEITPITEQNEAETPPTLDEPVA